MAYYAIFEVESGKIERVIECPEFLVDRIKCTSGQAVAKLPKEIKDTDYKIVGDELIKINH